MAITELTPAQALRLTRGGARLIDVRESHERVTGMADGAQGVDRAALEAEPGAHAPDPQAPLILICQSGRRSLQAAEVLASAGYVDVASVAGGTTRWRDEDLPMTLPEGDIDLDFHDRYARHLRLPEIGEAGQRRLADASVLVIGAGGLGSPAAYYLAAAGVGTLRIADDDVVDRSNLQRQILHAEDRIGLPKASSAATTLSALNPRARLEPVIERVTGENIDRLIEGVDVVLDGADNFPVRYLLNDACVRHAKPLVYGAVHRFEGQVSVFDAGRARGLSPCYRCLFPEPPPPEAAPNCSEVGVLGVLPGVIGLLQATEVLKLLLGLGEPLSGRLLQFDALRMQFRQTRLAPDPECKVCAPGREFAGYIDYAAFCAGG